MPIKIPIGVLPKFANTGRLYEVRGVDVIVQSYLMILSTVKGSRVWNPDFGCDLTKQIYELATEETFNAIREDIKSALTRWEPRATLKNVETEWFKEYKMLKITINFSYNGKDYTKVVPYADGNIQSLDELNIYKLQSGDTI